MAESSVQFQLRIHEVMQRIRLVDNDVVGYAPSVEQMRCSRNLIFEHSKKYIE